MKINLKVMAITIPILFSVGIAATIAADIWTTTSSKKPAVYRDGEFAGTYNPADIRGSYTFKEVSDLFEIELATLYKAFGIDKKTNGSAIKTKDLESLYQDIDVAIGNEAVQVFVGLYKNLPIEMDGISLPEQAVDLIVSNNPNLTDSQKASLRNNEVILENTNRTLTAKTDSEKGESNSGEEPVVNGTTTFKQLLDAGISKTEIENVLGAKMPPTNQSVKDYCMAEGLSFGTIKAEFTALVQ